MATSRSKKSAAATQRTYDLNCPIAKSLDLMGDRWTLLILRDLFISTTCRYVELRRSLEGISPTLLSQRLKELVEHGLVERLEENEESHVRYTLTKRGRETRPVLVALAQFGLPLIDGRVPDKAWKAFTGKNA